MAPSNAPARVWPWAVVTGVAAGVISLLRLWMGNSQAITENLWAEDGLFPLCIHKADFFTCLADPFAGYLLFLPRVLAWPVSLTPWESWALVANVLAAALAGLMAALVLVIARGAHLGWFVSVVIALLPVITPMAGLEALNSIGSSYMLLLYASTIALALAGIARPSRWSAIVVGALLLVTSLTIPSAVVLVPLVIAQLVRGAMSTKVAASWMGAVVVGTVIQVIAALSADSRREINFDAESLTSWANSIPTSLLTYWPGLSIGEHVLFTNFRLASISFTGWLLAVGIAIAGLFLLGSGWRLLSQARASAGLLLVAGLGFGVIPTAIGEPNNRYFVVPLALWGAAVLLLLESRISRARPWVLAVATGLVLVIWWPAIPASEYRTTPAPPWTDEVARVEAKCVSDPAFVDRPIFSPFWPPNWGDGLTEPTHPNLPCLVVVSGFR